MTTSPASQEFATLLSMELSSYPQLTLVSLVITSPASNVSVTLLSMEFSPDPQVTPFPLATTIALRLGSANGHVSLSTFKTCLAQGILYGMVQLGLPPGRGSYKQRTLRKTFSLFSRIDNLGSGRKIIEFRSEV